VSTDEFAERLAKVRQRFISSLATKIDETYAALPYLAGDDVAVVPTVSETYRRIHGISGIGRSVGFVNTGQAARDLETVLLSPYREQRGLAANELDDFKKALDALHEAAHRELLQT
jgi:HPt (histidine-containing phosphotransfer) domain-containing protein